jgi:hypothetical protein
LAFRHAQGRSRCTGLIARTGRQVRQRAQHRRTPLRLLPQRFGYQAQIRGITIRHLPTSTSREVQAADIDSDPSDIDYGKCGHRLASELTYRLTSTSETDTRCQTGLFDVNLPGKEN